MGNERNIQMSDAVIELQAARTELHDIIQGAVSEFNKNYPGIEVELSSQTIKSLAHDKALTIVQVDLTL